MNHFLSTNVHIYKTIADEAYQTMVHLIESGSRPNSDGSGWTVTFDPKQTSFKQAMISIVFTGMWIEALMHLLIVEQHGEATFKKYDFKPYEEKLILLGCADDELLQSASHFQKVRKSLVHEKAYFDEGEILLAQMEAKNAHSLLVSIHNLFPK